MLASELYDRIRRRLDLEPSGLHVDDELEAICIEAYLDLWDIMVAAMGNEAPWEIATLATVAGQMHLDVAQATGVYRMGRLDFRGSSECYEPLLRFNMATDPMHSTARAWSGPGSARYFARRSFRPTQPALNETTGQLFAWKIYFDPIPSAVYSLRLFYVPGPAIAYAAGGAAVVTDYPNEWPEYVVNAACAKLRIKEEADPTEFERERDRQVVIIERYCKPHQIDSPQFMADHRRLQVGMVTADDAWWRR